LKPSKREVKAFLLFLEEAERYKPFQVAKRRVYSRYNLLGTRFDRVTTSIVYKLYRLAGILDHVLRERFNVEPGRLLRQYLRLAVYLAQFDEVGDREFSETVIAAAAAIAARRFRPGDAELVERVYRELTRRPWQPGSREEQLMLRLLLPPILIEALERLLPPGEVEAFAEAVNARQPLLGFRVNRLKATVEDVLRELRRLGVEAWESRRVPYHVSYRGGLDYQRFRPLQEGWVVPQDEASAAAAWLLSPPPGAAAADLAAAPGGKTTHMAELMALQGRIVAFDVYHDRMLRLLELAQRTGTIAAIDPVEADARRAHLLLGEERASHILLDPPCTSTGALAKHPEARWRLTRRSIEYHVRLQREMLEAAARLLKPGGRLLYTVCSVLPEEGEENVRWFLERHPGFRLVPLHGPYDPSPLLPGTMRAWPHRHGTTGFFYALLEKRG